MEFGGKVVLITGASAGIGACTAAHFSLLGATLALTGRDPKALAKVAEECRKASPLKADVLEVVGDLENNDFPERLLRETIKKFKRLDVLVNNAGVAYPNTISNLQPDKMDQVFQINVFAVARLTSLAAPYLVETKGNIVNVSSIAGLRSFSSLLAYCSSKSALDQMTRCISLELAPKQVRVNCVNPGLIESTKIQRRAGLREEEYKEYLERGKRAHAMGRNGKPEEVAAAIIFLASSAASFITGVSLPVDGGRHAMCPVTFK